MTAGGDHDDGPLSDLEDGEGLGALGEQDSRRAVSQVEDSGVRRTSLFLGTLTMSS